MYTVFTKGWPDNMTVTIHKRRRSYGRHRRNIRRRDGDNCHWCKKPIQFNRKWDDMNTPLGPSIEHLTPLSAGGTNDLDNLVLAHRKCNR